MRTFHMRTLSEVGRTEIPRVSPASDLEVQPMETSATLRQRLDAAPGHRFLVALLCIAAVVVWLFTMHTMSSTAAELSHLHAAVGSGSVVAAEEHRATEAISTAAPDPVSGAASGALSPEDISCSLFGIGCIAALLIASIKTLPARQTIARFMSRRPTRVVAYLMQQVPRPPSLIELSISRT